MTKLYLGIDLGGTNVKIGLFDSEINLISKTSAPTQADKGPEHVMEIIAQSSFGMFENIDYSKDDLVYAGIGCPGPVDLAKGIIVDAPNIPLFNGYPLREQLSLKLGIPVTMENDANAAGWGEHVLGAAKGVEEMVFLTLGTGIGGAVITNGELVHGHLDAGGELGHLVIFPNGRQCGCGQKGCAEAYASAGNTGNRAMEAIAQGKKTSLEQVKDNKGTISCKDVYEHRSAGDEVAGEIADLTEEVLGRLCVLIQNFISPARILFAGGMIAEGQTLLDRIIEQYRKFAWPGREDTLEICFATLGEDSGIIGNAALAMKASEK